MSHNGFITLASIVATTAQDSEQQNDDAMSTTADDGLENVDALATPPLVWGYDAPWQPRDNEGGQKWCKDCDMWLNGNDHFDAHLIGKNTARTYGTGLEHQGHRGRVEQVPELHGRVKQGPKPKENKSLFE